MDEMNWLDEADGRLTRAMLGWSEITPVVKGIQKHARYALEHPEEVDLKKACKHIKGMMTATMVNFPELEEHFRPVLEKWE